MNIRRLVDLRSSSTGQSMKKLGLDLFAAGAGQIGCPLLLVH
jgi:hypothetical protein